MHDVLVELHSVLPAFNKKEALFYQQTGLTFMEETLYGAGTWTLGISEIPGTP